VILLPASASGAEARRDLIKQGNATPEVWAGLTWQQDRAAVHTNVEQRPERSSAVKEQKRSVRESLTFWPKRESQFNDR
jgi:hypothetical protein